MINRSLRFQFELVSTGTSDIFELELTFLVLACDDLSHLVCRGYLKEELLALGTSKEVELFMAIIASYLLPQIRFSEEDSTFVLHAERTGFECPKVIATLRIAYIGDKDAIGGLALRDASTLGTQDVFRYFT